MTRLACLILLFLPGFALGDVLVAARNLAAGSIVAEEDVTPVAQDIPGAARLPAQVVGQEIRHVVYAGRPLMLADLGAPTLVQRNQIVQLVYRRGGLTILTEGRAMDRGGAGEIIRAINTGSHQTVRALVGVDGTVSVLSD